MRKYKCRKKEAGSLIRKTNFRFSWWEETEQRDGDSVQHPNSSIKHWLSIPHGKSFSKTQASASLHDMGPVREVR